MQETEIIKSYGVHLNNLKYFEENLLSKSRKLDEIIIEAIEAYKKEEGTDFYNCIEKVISDGEDDERVEQYHKTILLRLDSLGKKKIEDEAKKTITKNCQPVEKYNNATPKSQKAKTGSIN